MKPTAIYTPMTASLNEPWERISDDARKFHELVERLRRMPADDPEREDLEAEVGGVLAVLAIGVRVLDEAVMEAIDRDDDEDEELDAPQPVSKPDPRAA